MNIYLCDSFPPLEFGRAEEFSVFSALVMKVLSLKRIAERDYLSPACEVYKFSYCSAILEGSGSGPGFNPPGYEDDPQIL